MSKASSLQRESRSAAKAGKSAESQDSAPRPASEGTGLGVQGRSGQPSRYSAAQHAKWDEQRIDDMQRRCGAYDE